MSVSLAELYLNTWTTDNVQALRRMNNMGEILNLSKGHKSLGLDLINN